MRNNQILYLKDPKTFIKKLLIWSKQFSYTAVLLSNKSTEDAPTEYYKYDLICGADSTDTCILNSNPFFRFREWYNTLQDWVFGYFSYDLKDEIINSSSNKDFFYGDQGHFFCPKHLFLLLDNKLCTKTSIALDYLKLFSYGRAAVPYNGMIEFSNQLKKTIPIDKFVFNEEVVSVKNNAVTTKAGNHYHSQNIIFATDLNSEIGRAHV